MITVADYMQYCQVNAYFTCGTCRQYERAFGYCRMINSQKGYNEISRLIHDLALITWLCSDPEYAITVTSIEEELWRLYKRYR